MSNEKRKLNNLPYWVRNAESGIGPLISVYDFGHLDADEGWVIAECYTENDAERVASSLADRVNG